jgi:uncharacterized alpha-E superfamily protein
VLDLLMNEEVNPRSLAFQAKDLFEHCGGLSRMPSGAGWPFIKQKCLEDAALDLFRSDVRVLCEPGASGSRERLDALLEELEGALPSLSNAVTHSYFSHAETERIT